MIPVELLERTRIKAYTTLISICDDMNYPGEIRLQAALALLAVTEREVWADDIDAQPGDEDGEQVSQEDPEDQLMGASVTP